MNFNSNIYERLLKIVEYHNIENINIFALKYLGYKSAEKLYRLNRENSNPSFEIIQDIANKFPEIDMNWFITGQGNMLKKDNVEGNIFHEPQATYQKVTLNYKDAFDYARAEAEHHREMNKALLIIIENLQKK
jgi:hypothetical protein